MNGKTTDKIFTEKLEIKSFFLPFDVDLVLLKMYQQFYILMLIFNKYEQNAQKLTAIKI